jgi:hypothetical protein
LGVIDDTIGYLDFNNLPGMILAVDYTKAFDNISKDFVIDVFRIFGEQFTQWAKAIMANPESCVNYIGWLTGFFPLESGIRQGCPFYPLAFVLAVDIFSLKICQCSDIKGIQRPDNKTHKIGQYADDATLFLRDENDVKTATSIMELVWLGYKIHCGDVLGFKCKQK